MNGWMKPWRKKVPEKALPAPQLTPLDLEVEERLAQLGEAESRFAELVARGVPPVEAFARSGIGEPGYREVLASRPVCAAISALRERALAGERTDIRTIRMAGHKALEMSIEEHDSRGTVNAARFLAELDGHLEKERQGAQRPEPVTITINIGPPPPGAIHGPESTARPACMETIEVGGRRIPAHTQAIEVAGRRVPSLSDLSDVLS
jgi:hypothetical protein